MKSKSKMRKETQYCFEKYEGTILSDTISEEDIKQTEE